MAENTGNYSVRYIYIGDVPSDGVTMPAESAMTLIGVNVKPDSVAIEKEDDSKVTVKNQEDNTTFAEILEAYEQRYTPEQVSVLVDELIAEFEITSGVKSEESSHMEEVFGEESSITVNLEESIGLTSNVPEKINLSPLAPLKQIKEGVEPENIQCKESFKLIFKSSGQPACVKETSVQKLISWGWTQ